MAKVNTVSFGPGQQDLQVQHMELQRRQAMIDALRKESMDPLEVQQHGPVASKINPWQGVAKLAQAYFANEGQKDVDTRKVDLDQKMRTRQAEALSQLFPDAVPSEGAELTPKQQGQNALNARILKMMQLNPDVGWKLAENALSLTPEQKNMAAMGQDPIQMGRLGVAKATKDGFLELQPGTTTVNLTTGAERFQPKVGEGINVQNGVAGAMPGYAGANAEIKGAESRASAAGQAGYDMVTINTPAGPVMMTKEQAAQMSGAPQRAPIEFTASNGTKLNFSNMSPQQVWDGVSKSGDAALVQAFKEYAVSQKAPGIALMSPEEQERRNSVAREGARTDAELVRNAQSPEAQAKVTDNRSLIQLLDEAEPLLKVSTGSAVGALTDKALGTVGLSTKGAQAAAELSAIGARLVGMQPKFPGPSSDRDVKIYEQAAGQIGDASLPTATRMAALQRIRNLAQRAVFEQANSITTRAVDKIKNGGGWKIEEVK